jgi:hypothetical protein
MRIQAGQPVYPYPMHRLYEGNALRIDITSLDWDQDLEAPDTLQYRIDNLTDNVAVTDWTTIATPGTTSTLTIAAAVNAMYSNWRDTQLMQVTFQAVYADGSQAQVIGVYELARLYQGVG